MSRYWAIVSNNAKASIEWFMDAHRNDIKEYVATHQMFILHSGIRVKVIVHVQQCQGYEFEHVIICPTYTDLRMEVMKRVR